MDDHASQGQGLSQSTEWSGWIWDDRGYWYSSRTGPTGLQEYAYRYPEQETPRTPGLTVFDTATNQQPMYQSAPISTSNNAYTTTHQVSFSSPDNDPTPRQSSYSVVRNHSYQNPPDNTNSLSNIGGSFSYPSTSYDSWRAARNLAPSIEGATRDINSLSLTQPAPPPDAFDSRVAERLGNTKHIYKAPNSGDTEILDTRYVECGGVEEDRFWKVGRVFMMLWTEPAAKSKVPVGGGTRNGSHFSTTWLNQAAYSEIRRFVVVIKGHGNSICCPIHTYSGQATLKPKLPAPNLHTIIHTTPECPGVYEYTYKDKVISEKLTKDPIRVISENKESEGHLHELSRLNYSKVYTVEHYVRVLNIGMVASTSMNSLIYDSGWSNVHRPVNEQQPRQDTHQHRQRKPHKPRRQ